TTWCATVTVMVYGASLGRLSPYRWVTAPKVKTPGSNLRVVADEPSPQAMVTVCASFVPGSVKLPLNVVVPPSKRSAGLALTVTPDGRTLPTWTWKEAGGPASPSLSVTVTRTT